MNVMQISVISLCTKMNYMQAMMQLYTVYSSLSLYFELIY